MAYAKDTYTGNGSSTNFTVTFPYLSQTHVQVYVDGVLKALTTDYTWFNSTTISFNVAPADTLSIVFVRNSNQPARISDFQDGSTLTAALLDYDATQTFYVAQESFDKADDALAAASGVTVPVLPISNGGTSSNNESAARINLGLEIGVDVQAYDVDTAKTDVAQTFSAPQKGTLTTDDDLSFDLSVTNNFFCTPTAGGALTFTNIATAGGQSGLIKFVNGSNYAITPGSGTKWGATTAAIISATGTYMLTYLCDGTNVYVVNSGALA
jgi:hypothetical protein